ncbi:hypothetical protein J437_LFUL011686 [Ladona fulva]|uniref:Caspase family p20 domain-containing protein n=1 Tax=Ladona fulva TaxID=123851 RepID=A0A8K0KL16_LADFU|nr:hypothetical protein J437_LFUL011686 [Ladona fulva]
MDPTHRAIIRSNIPFLIDSTDFAILLPKLVEKGVFLENMALKYKNVSDRASVRDMYLNILTRGPEAFTKLVSALHDTGHYRLASLLDPGVTLPKYSRRVHPCQLANYHTEDPNTLIRMKEFAEKHPHSHINISTEPLKIRVRHSSAEMKMGSQLQTPIYQMTSRPKGFAMIINIKKYENGIQEERIGAENDEKNLTNLFEELGYSVIIARDLKGMEMVKELKTYAGSQDHSNVDSCILAVLCHGELIGGENYFVAADGQRIGMNSVLELFSNKECQRLAKKPKLFFFQGDGKSHGLKEEKRTGTDGSAEVPLRAYSDMLIAYATVNGKVNVEQ